VTSTKYHNGFDKSSRSPLSVSPCLTSQTLDNDNIQHSPPNNSSLTKKTRWVPPQLVRDITDRNEIKFRRVRGLLNKLTPENFDKLSYRLINIGIDHKTVLKGVIILIFEKAIDEPKYCNLYAQLCLKLSHEVANFDTDSNTNTFLRLLLSKCQEEFETRSKASSAFDKQDVPLSAEQQEEKQIAKRKMLGNIKFIGELGKLELLQEVILHKCVQQLLAKKKRILLADMGEDIECLCQIITTVGRRLDTLKAKNIMNQYFDRIEKLSESAELPARIRFMLQDVMELRRNQWIPRRIQQDNGPRSVSQIRWEMMGPMLPPPPFPFFAHGMVPPNMLDQTSNGMSWFPDPMFNGIHGPPVNKNYAEFVDDGKDIFGKPVQNSTSAVKKQATAVKMQAKPDLFEPHYLKSKGSQSKSSFANDLTAKTFGGKRASEDEKKNSKPFNKSNPWNIDPFAPHYTKPSSSIFTANEELKASPPTKSENPLTPQMLHSSPSSSRQHRNSQQVVYNKSNGKKNDEISLRPTSFLKKKEEKPKSLFAKAEELPPNMQQFTNLTINDKTASNNKTNKKSILTKADIDNKLKEFLDEFEQSKDIEQIRSCIKSLASTSKYSKMVAKQLFYIVFAKDKNNWELFVEIFVECRNNEVLSTDIIVNAFLQLFDDIRVVESTDGKDFLAALAALFIAQDLIPLGKMMEQFQDGHHYPTALLCLARLQTLKEKDVVKELVKLSKVDLKLIFAQENRSDDNIMKEVQVKDLLYLFPHLCLKEELLHMMKDTSNDTDHVATWIKDQIVGKLENKQLVHIIITCMVVIATQDTLSTCDINQKPEKELQEKEKEVIDTWKVILKEHLGTDNALQLEAIYALQIYCYEKQYPKEMLLRLFIIFYNLEIIEEDIFLQWKEDMNDVYSGKGKALFQVNNWLQWLETADEEDEIEEED